MMYVQWDSEKLFCLRNDGFFVEYYGNKPLCVEAEQKSKSVDREFSNRTVVAEKKSSIGVVLRLVLAS